MLLQERNYFVLPASGLSPPGRASPHIEHLLQPVDPVDQIDDGTRLKEHQ